MVEGGGVGKIISIGRSVDRWVGSRVARYVGQKSAPTNMNNNISNKKNNDSNNSSIIIMIIILMMVITTMAIVIVMIITMIIVYIRQCPLAPLHDQATWHCS